MAEVLERQRQAFLAYAFSDRAYARRIAKALAALGVRALDPASEAEAGEEWDAKVLELMAAADAVVFVVPEREGVGKDALFELGAARAMGKKIVPVVHEPHRFANADIAISVARTAAIDASAFSDEQTATSIAAALRAG